jgi:hypothetical protein
MTGNGDVEAWVLAFHFAAEPRAWTSGAGDGFVMPIEGRPAARLDVASCQIVQLKTYVDEARQPSAPSTPAIHRLNHNR